MFCKFGNVFWVIQITQIKQKVEFLRYILLKRIKDICTRWPYKYKFRVTKLEKMGNCTGIWIAEKIEHLLYSSNLLTKAAIVVWWISSLIENFHTDSQKIPFYLLTLGIIQPRNSQPKSPPLSPDILFHPSIYLS